MSELRAYLDQFDATWSHDFESLQYALRDLSDEESQYQAPCYSKETAEEGWPLPGSIRWQIAHLIHCKRHYTQHFLRVVSGEPVEATPWTSIEALDVLTSTLEEIHQAQRASIAALLPEHLDQVAGNDMPFREFLAMTIRHDAWHAGQIELARRLYRSR